MAELICNLPATDVWVRKEYLRDHTDGHGEFVKGVWVSAKSIPGRAFYFETYLPEYGALFDKLPISAFIVRENDNEVPTLPNPDLDLKNLQFWNCMDWGVVSIHKQFIGSMDFEVNTKNFGTMNATYIATLDNYHSISDEVDWSTSEKPSEHKSFNLLELENGQFCLYPNNRMRVIDISLSPEKLLKPDFKVSSVYYSVENENKWGRLGDTEDYFWKTEKEKEEI